MKDIKNEFEEDFKEISEKYRGIRKESLEEMSPWYSCVICKKFLQCGAVSHACSDSEPATEEEFASWYEF